MRVKNLFLIALMTLFLTVSFGQTIIPKAGVALSSLAVDDNQGDYESSIGFNLGVGLNLPLSEKLSIQPELNFIQKGFKIDAVYSGDGFSTKEESTTKINYLELPVLAKITFGSNAKFYLNAGPSIAIGLGGKYKYTYSGSFIGEPFSESGDAKVRFGDSDNENEDDVYFDNRLDVGVQVGGGAIIADKIMIDIRYGLGLSDLVDDEKSKNRVLQFTVGIPLTY